MSEDQVLGLCPRPARAIRETERADLFHALVLFNERLLTGSRLDHGVAGTLFVGSLRRARVNHYATSPLSENPVLGLFPPPTRAIREAEGADLLDALDLPDERLLPGINPDHGRLATPCFRIARDGMPLSNHGWQIRKRPWKAGFWLAVDGTPLTDLDGGPKQFSE